MVASQVSSTQARDSKSGDSLFDLLTIGIAVVFLILIVIALVLMVPGYSISKDATPGYSAFRGRQFEAALPHFENLTRRVPKSGDYWVKLAICQLETGEAEAALTSLQQAVSVAPSLKLDREFGMVYAELKRFDEAAPYLLRAIQLDPLDADTNFYQGLALLERQQYAQAAAAFAIAGKDTRLQERATPHREAIEKALLGDRGAALGPVPASANAATTGTATAQP